MINNICNKHLWAALGLATCCIFFVLDPLGIKSNKLLVVDNGQGVSSASSLLSSRLGMEVIPITGGGTGPESLAFDPDGKGPYTGISNGGILKWQGTELGWIHYASVSPQNLLEKCKNSQDVSIEHLCGRPLGLQFSKKTGDLYIADAYFGLLKVRPGEKFATPVVTHVEGVPLHFTNGLDIGQESGIVYFTDSSSRFRRRDHMSIVISGDKTGRIMSYNPNTNQTLVLLSGLSFPNGISLTSDSSSLLFAETSTCRILKYPLHTNKDPQVLAHLPGFPDNIKPSPSGGFWVGLHSKNTKLAQFMLSLPCWLREAFVGFPLDLHWAFSVVRRWSGEALAVRISEEGEIIEFMDGFGGGGSVKYISEVEEYNGTLLVGSPYNPFVGVYMLENNPSF